MAISKVVVVDGNNLTVRIDRGVAGRGITDVEPVEIDNQLYLEFTFSDGTTETVGPVGTIQYIGESPIVIDGPTISLTTVPVTLGGTNATTAAGARTNLNAANQDTTISAGTGLSGGGSLAANRTISIANTAVTAASYGAASKTLTATVNAQGQLTALADTPIAIANTQISGLGTMSTQNANAVAITGGSITGITDLAIADGGTGASTAAGARTNLGLGTAAVLNAGVANGVATLDAGGTVPLSQIPASIQGGVSYQGSWNAATNTPTIVSSVGTKGHYYVVSVAGSTNINGITDWLPGDWIIFNGSVWEQIDNTDAVASVNGYTGVVVLSNTDVGAPSTSLTISAGTGLTGGGDLTTNRTISIANTAVSAGSYGTASAVPSFTVNGQGQLTAAANTTIAIANTQVSGLGTMSTQNANAVAITGGTATLTSLTVNDNTTLGSSNTDEVTFTARVASEFTPSTANTYDLGRNSHEWRNLYLTGTANISALTASGAVTLSGGTANGVAYLNGSKVLTTGSALTFDGTLLSANSSSAGSTVQLLKLSNTGSGANTKAQIGFFAASTQYSQITGGYGASSSEMNFQLTAAGAGFMTWGLSTGTEAMRLTSTGLGIGTSSPSYKLDVNGSTRVIGTFVLQNGDFALTTKVDPMIYTNAANPIRFGINSSEQMRIDSSGNLGIGTSSPATKLTVVDTSGTGTTRYRQLELGNNFSSQKLYSGVVADTVGSYIQNNAYYDNSFQYNPVLTYSSGLAFDLYGNISFRTNSGLTAGVLFTPTERMRITSTGLVGIGTSSPTNALSVTGNANVTGNVTLGDATTDTVTVNGYMGVGGAATAANGVWVRSNALTGTGQTGLRSTPTGTSAATSFIAGVYAGTQTEAAAFTASAVYQMFVDNTTKGAGSTITNQYGVYVADQTQGTNNYGITSLVSSGANKWNIYASGTAANYFAGNVGIGTSSPAKQLDLAANNTSITTGDPLNTLRFTDTDTTSAAGQPMGRIEWFSSDADTAGVKAYIQAQSTDGSPDADMVFATNHVSGGGTAERMRIQYDGNLGIGTTAPSGVLQAIKSGANLVIGDGGTSLNRFDANTQIFRTGSFAETMRIDGSGNVGIGTSSPSAKLDVAGNGTANVPVIISNSNRSTTNAGVFSMYGYNASIVATEYGRLYSTIDTNTASSEAGSMVFQTINAGTLAERMRINSSGNVGIGTSSPGAKLNVVGSPDATFNSQFLIGNSSATTQKLAFNPTVSSGIAGLTDGALAFYANGANTERMRLDASGNLGVGTTSPTARIHSNGTIQAVTGSTGIQIYGDGGTGYVNSIGAYPLVFQVNSTERARIDSSGNLLVGTTSSGALSGSGLVLSGNGIIRQGIVSPLTVFTYFYYAGTQVGSISTTGAATAYNTSSDYRLKNITGPITTSGAYIDSLNPVEGTWKADGSTFVGLIAHEVQEASRTTVATGVKDGEEMQGMDYSSAEIIANLIAEVKSLRQRLAAAGI